MKNKIKWNTTMLKHIHKIYGECSLKFIESTIKVPKWGSGWYKPWWEIKIWTSKGCSVILFALYAVQKSRLIFDLTVIARVPLIFVTVKSDQLINILGENNENLTEIWLIWEGGLICQNEGHNGNVKTGTSIHSPPVVSSKIIWVHFSFLFEYQRNTVKKNKIEITIEDNKTDAWFHEKFCNKYSNSVGEEVAGWKGL